MNNRLISIIIGFILLLAPISVEANDGIVSDNIKIPIEETSAPDIGLDELPPMTETLLNNSSKVSEVSYKTPLSKRKIVFKFLAAMSGVIISSISIFVGLSVYNKIRENFVAQKNLEASELSPQTPKDLTSAIRVFLEKTDWK